MISPDRSKQSAHRRLRILYAIQNVGGIDFARDIGDTVPVKHTLRGLSGAGHEVKCLKLEGRSARIVEDLKEFKDYSNAPLGWSDIGLFKAVESGTRRLQRELKLPYFAFFDSYRFSEACLKVLPHFDVCHEHNGLFCIGAAWACKRLGIPYVLTFSADPLLELNLVGRPLKGFHAAVAVWEMRFTLNLARKILCVSEPAKKQLSETWKVDAEKIVVMANGVDIQVFGAAYDAQVARARLGLDGVPVISFVGGFQPWHGIDRLIESFSQVLGKFPQSKLLLIGDGPARPMIENKIEELGVRDSVTITGLVPQGQIPEMLSAVDVAVIPYPRLPKDLWFSPLKLYEYMAAGKAIVASRAGQIAEVIQDGYNGILVEAGDVKALADAMVRLIQNPEERTRLGQNARRQALEQHSWERYVERVEAAYRSVLDQSSNSWRAGAR